MKIAAVLVWFHEPLPFLERLTRSLGGVVDEFLCFDGAWEHFWHRDFASGPQETEMIRATAEAVGLPVRFFPPEALYPTQVAKRSFAYGTACEYADWIIVLDGDEFIEYANGFRERLETTALNCGIIHSTRVAGRLKLIERTPRRVFRTKWGLEVEEAHNGVHTLDGRWFAGPRRIQKEQAIDLTPNLGMRHEAMSRGKRRNEQAAAYYAMRARKRIEVH